ncbi:hypothetical protein K469DRAFT_585532, partial [Zopfia rhizophila CBS 207.26]
NFDETGFYISYSSKQIIVTFRSQDRKRDKIKDAKKIIIRSETNRDYLTSVEAILLVVRLSL